MRELLALLVAVVIGSASHAAMWVVNDAVDAPDANPGDGACETASGRCPPRAAIDEANALPGFDVIFVPPQSFPLHLGVLSLMDDVALIGATSDCALFPADCARLTQQGNARVIHIFPGVSAMLFGIGIVNGSAEFGAGLRNEGKLRFLNGTIENNSASSTGGGIFNSESADLEIDDSLIASNSARESAGGILNLGNASVDRTIVRENGANVAGGIFHDAILSGGSLFIADSTIGPDNFATSSGAGLVSFQGALSIRNSTICENTSGDDGAGAAVVESTAELTNTTISGNQSLTSAGLVVIDSEVTINNGTITANNARGPGGGIGAFSEGAATAVTLSNTILAGNRGLSLPDDGRALPGIMESAGHNLIGVGDALNFPADGTDLIGSASMPIDPHLEALAENGGHVPTHVPLPGSPAIDAGSPKPTGTPGAVESTDARGVPRPQDGNADGVALGDIGAAEGTACSDGRDNDADGQIDAAEDAGCRSLADLSELPDCNDTIDNDGDKQIDYPNDRGCSDPDDSSEQLETRFGEVDEGPCGRGGALCAPVFFLFWALRRGHRRLRRGGWPAR